MTRTKSVNLEAVAAEAHVSSMTVSRVLRHSSGVRPATRERVLEAAGKLGYRPNPVVSAFMNYVRSSRIEDGADVIAFLTDGNTRHAWRTFEVYARFMNGARAHAESRGYRMEEFWIREPGMTSRRLSTVLHARGIRGIVVGPMTAARAHLNLKWENFSVSTIGHSLLRPQFSRATNDQFSSMQLAVRELRRLGYERIGLAMPWNNDARVHYLWSGAFLSCHWRYSPKHKPIVYLPKKWDNANALAWILRERPQAIVTTEPFKILARNGFAIPEDIGIATLDWTRLQVPSSGVDQLSEQIGAAAIDIVLDQISRNEYGIPVSPRTVLLKGRWVPGATVQRMKRQPTRPRSKRRLTSA